MKKLLSMLMVIAVFFSVITVPVKAEPKTGSITISNPTVGQEYAIYQIFEATVNVVNGQADGIAYSMKRTNQNKVLFDELFGEDGKKPNPYFLYNPDTDVVKLKDSVQSTDVYNYLKGVIAKVIDPEQVDPDQVLAPIQKPITATKDTVNENGEVIIEGTLNDDGSITFTEVPYGYYFVTSSLGSVVSINSTSPNMVVIDKNQKPGNNFKKYVQLGVSDTQKTDAEGNPLYDESGKPIYEPIWGEQNSANIGDKVSFKVNFEATNYDGMNKIEYYQIVDQKGEALWVEFNTIEVYVGGEKLNHGHYICNGYKETLNPSDEWQYLGDWSDIPEGDRDINDAQWYLVHYGYDQFRILIPWLEGHKVEIRENQVTADDGTQKTNLSYTLSYESKDPGFLYESPSQVEVYYDAGVEYNANIGESTTSKLFNRAEATWTFGSNSNSTPPSTTETKVYGIGITKIDGAAPSVNLAGAQFEVLREVSVDGDNIQTEPVFVIPTGIDGVYILDSLNTYVGEQLSGVNRQPTREIYAAYLEDYLGEGYETKQKNIVTSQVNGKFVILGLSEGVYYLKETVAPEGYNLMDKPYKIVIDKTNSTSFSIFVDENGHVGNVGGANEIYSEVNYSLVNGTIENGKGATLPTTGAEGTIKLITIGSFITIACGILLITNKKMSIYRD